MEFENSAWAALNEEDREAALEWTPPPLHAQLRASFRSCLEEAEAREAMFFDLGKTRLHAKACESV